MKRKAVTAVERVAMLEQYCRGRKLKYIAKEFGYASRGGVLTAINREIALFRRKGVRKTTRDWLFV